MSLYSGDWSEYRETMCVCPKCSRDEITHCICDEEASNDDDIKKAFSDEINE